jgi:hypothetical protein
VRHAVVAIVVMFVACHRDAATGTAPAGGTSRSVPPGNAILPIPGHPSGVTDDELVAFTRWQRDYMDLFRRNRAELDAVGRDDPSRPLGDFKEFEPRVTELVARQAPAMKAHLGRMPLKGRKAELVTEAIGGILHFDILQHGYKLVIVRDEVRLDAARRRFGREAIDDIVKRESLILSALQGP